MLLFCCPAFWGHYNLAAIESFNSFEYAIIFSLLRCCRIRYSFSVHTTTILTQGDVVADAFGKSASAIIKRLLDNPNDKDFDPVPLLHGSMLKKQEDIRLSIDGCITNEQSEKISMCYEHLNYIKNAIAKIDAYSEKIAAPFSNEINLVTSVPGFRKLAATIVISEIGTDMSVFHSAKHLCSWAGLTPQNNESAGKKKSVRVSRAGVYIKPLLVQCANAAIHDKSYNHFRKHQTPSRA